MRHLSTFSGIGGFDLAFERAGMTTVGSVEFDVKCRAVLARHFPDVPQFNDIKEFDGRSLPFDVFSGGFPCQDLSVAGRRAGLAGARSGLFYEVARVLDEAKPEWVVLENVPGLLSSNGGRDMGAVVGTLAELGYMGAYRVLDAQNFGVAQRRRRVFIVGRLGRDGAEQVLFEPEGVRGDSPPSREAGPRVAADPEGRVAAGGAAAFDWTVGGGGTEQRETGKSRIWMVKQGDYAGALSTSKVQAVYYGLAIPFDTTQLTSATNRSNPQPGSPCHPLAAKAHPPAIAFHLTQDPISGPVSPALSKGTEHGCATVGDADGVAVRRLTPTECERLQGFPDGWTDQHADSTRYKQLGNAVAVPVVEWIARRLVAVSNA